MLWFKKSSKPAVAQVHKYVEQMHWNHLQENFKLVQAGKYKEVIQSGLKYENNVRHTGEALLLFDSFFIANGSEYLDLRKRLCNQFVSGDALEGFDAVDKQYLLDVAASSMRLHFPEEARNETIHNVANSEPDIKNVNSLLTRLFRVVSPENTKSWNELDAEIISWYAENIRDISNRSVNPYYKDLLDAVTQFSGGLATDQHLQILQGATSSRSVDAYASNFTITPERLAKDPWAIVSKIGKFGQLVSNEIVRRELME